MGITYHVIQREDCEACSGTGKHKGKTCLDCNGAGCMDSELELTTALVNLGVMEPLTSMEQIKNHNMVGARRQKEESCQET